MPFENLTENHFELYVTNFPDKICDKWQIRR